MVKNLFLLGLMTWAVVTYAKPQVAQESLADAESYKVEKAVEEQEAQRSVAGAKIKKHKKWKGEAVEKVKPAEGSDSEVRYWQYSE